MDKHDARATAGPMHRFSLYETPEKFYLVGGDIMDCAFRMLEIMRSNDNDGLRLLEHTKVYPKREMNALLHDLDDNHKPTGGLLFRSCVWGLLGFIRFTGPYYMLLVTKRSQAAMIGGHYLYQVQSSELVCLGSVTAASTRLADFEENRFLSTFSNLDLSKSFYFSYSYDITRSLQYNILRGAGENKASDRLKTTTIQPDPMFVWNHHLLAPALTALERAHDWCLPLIHGFIQQSVLSIWGRTVCIILIARRSRHFAGARFLKRGANDLGFVANDVETEQVVHEMQTTSFHAPGMVPFANPNYTAYVQHRGSIPLHWTQDNAGVSPKPDIRLSLVDPYFNAAASHFDNLFARYGTPVYVLNLVKARERTPRESILLQEYTNAVKYLNQALPVNKKIIYHAWDMSRAAKSHDQNVIDTLETTADEVVSNTGFFKNGRLNSSAIKLQNGVARTNCIDCLDRTNAAQFVIGKRALGHQLYSLGLVEDTSIDYDTDAVDLLTQMYHDHGDTIAMQYGGSHLVNTMETYRKINQWTSHSRDMVESFKRYYNNSFTDRQRQEAYNLFLGNYVVKKAQPMLWELSTDYYLHHMHPRDWPLRRRIQYGSWFSRDSLQSPYLTVPSQPHRYPAIRASNNDDFWQECYRPLALSSLSKVFAFKLNTTTRIVHVRSTQAESSIRSPFRVRNKLDDRLEVVDPVHPVMTPSKQHIRSLPHSHEVQTGPQSLPEWQQSDRNSSQHHENSLPNSSYIALQVSHQPGENTPRRKLAITQWTLGDFIANSLTPIVAAEEAYEYERYIGHPLNLPLVTTAEIPTDPGIDRLTYMKSLDQNADASTAVFQDLFEEFAGFLALGQEPLTVLETDLTKKRYKAYRQWVKGKSLFKTAL